MPYGISNDKFHIGNLRSKTCHRERSEDVVAYKVETN